MLCRRLAYFIGHVAAYLVPCPPVHPAMPPDESAPALRRCDWHEIKHDGFRVIARKEGERVRLSWHAWKAWAKLEELP
jgi:hypothetical protein